MDATNFENFRQLTDSLLRLKKALQVEKARLTAITRAAIPPYRSVADLHALNRLHIADIEMLTQALEEAKQRNSRLVDFLAGLPIWGKAEFIRRILRFVFRSLGFDAAIRSARFAEAGRVLDARKAEIESLDMHARQMQPDEIAAILHRINTDHAKRLDEVTAATPDLKTANDRLNKLDDLLAAVKDRRLPLGRGMPFAPGYALSIRRLNDIAEAGDIQSAFDLLKSLPVRVRPDAKDKMQFRSLTTEIIERWGKPKPIGLFGQAPNRLIVSEVIRVVQTAKIGSETLATIEDVNETLSTVGNLQKDIQAALYWIGSAAEHAILEKVPRIVKEEDYNFGLVTEIRGAAETTGRKLFLSLGYTLGFPFEIASWSTDSRDNEADTGADLCIIVYVTLEDGTTIVRGALLQGKRAVGLKANVFRENNRLGRNHQIIALTSGKALGYYTFYHHPAKSIGVSVVPAQEVKSVILGPKPSGKPLWEYPKAACDVATDRNATDFATFLAFTLMDAKHEFCSISDALIKMGESRTGFEIPEGKDTRKTLAGRLALVSVGGSLPEFELEILKGYGFQETARHERLTPPAPWTKG